MCRKLIYLISFVLVLSMAGIASADLVAHWPLDEDSGTTAVDISGNGHDGTIVGTANWVPGMNGLALDFDGSSTYIDIDERVVEGTFTYASWLRPRDIPYSGGYYAVWHNSSWGAGDVHAHLRADTSLLNIDINGGPGVTSTTVLQENEWCHFALTIDGSTSQLYINGVLEAENTAGSATAYMGPGFFGNWSGGARFYHGLTDDIRLYDHVLSEIEVLAAMQGKPWPYASSPTPEDGAVLTNFPGGVLGTSLSWKPGAFAVSHDVYFGENFDDVNDGTGDTLCGNQTSTYFLAGYGYTPNDPAPTGFVPGTTYYWRIDEVNGTEPNSPWKGDVWSFSLPPSKAYSEVPSDGAKFVVQDAQLSWVPGMGGITQTVYFGDDYDTVSTATTGGTDLGGSMTYDPGPLESDTAYYWRVDAFGIFGPITGDVWSFRTLPDIPLTSDPNLIGWWKLDEGEGTIALDWSGRGHHGTLVGDPEWVDGYDGGALQCDGTGDWATTQLMPADHGLDGANPKTTTAWVYTTGFTDAGIFDMGSQSNSQEWSLRTTGTTNQWRIQFWGTQGIDDLDFTYPTLNQWVHFGLTYDGSSCKLYANGQYLTGFSPVLNITNNAFMIGRYGASTSFNGIIDDLRIYNKALTLEEVQQTMRGDPLLAWNASPVSGLTPDLDEAVPLSWSPGDNASQHDVYFGTDEDDVEFADISDTTGIYRIRQSGTNYTPGEGVEWGGGPYYWRIDEYNTDGSISTGRVWNFTVADFISIDNIEGYDAEDQIWWHWIDGLGYVKPDNTSHPGNGSGSEVGDASMPSFTEETIVHGGGQSMPFNYNNNDPFKLKYSEAKLTLSDARDWTKHGVKALSLWFYGYPASVGSFTDNFDGTYSMTGSGADIWDISGLGTGFHDEFHFAYKTLTGAGTITARVDSVSAAHDWSKAGVMIRETLDANSVHAFACVTPASGVSFQRRPSIGAASQHDTTGDMNAPYWVKLERDLAGNFTVTRSADGSTWEPQGTLQNIPMTTNVYVGLAVTSHDVALTCEAAFSSVTITGNVTGQWASQDIGIQSNDPEPMYLAIANNTGQPAVVVHDDPNAAQIDEWTEWNIDLRDFAGINLADVNSIAVGLGNRNNPQAGGAGKMYFDDFALYRPRCVPEELTLAEADFNSDCVVDFRDLEIMTDNWLAVEPDPDVDLEADLNSDGTVDFKDYAVLADDWLEELIWPEL